VSDVTAGGVGDVLHGVSGDLGDGPGGGAHGDPVARARAVAGAVPDPEVPVLTIADLGVLRDVTVGEDGAVEVTVTPTYSGCPAMDQIREDVAAALRAAGFDAVRVRTVLAPAWTTDWMTEAGRAALLAYGIAPPAPARPAGAASGGGAGNGRGVVAVALSVRCPRCGSPDTREVARFGSTACKALWQCRACAEPFDSFKAI
jgi:ring-1,2-phenylacetyl-CoA epoxidase subunit PaaD